MSNILSQIRIKPLQINKKRMKIPLEKWVNYMKGKRCKNNQVKCEIYST